MLEVAETETAILLFDRNPVQAELAHLRPEVLREFVLLVDLRGDRRDLVAGEALRRFADRVRHFAQVEFEPAFGHASLLLGRA